MKMGICTIQRERGRWIEEWVAFHYAVGFRRFYIYLHRCTDNSFEVILNLQRYFDIKCYVIGDDTFRPQLGAYQHAYNSYGHEVDWIAFIDGDEFLFPTSHSNITEVMERFTYEKVSAVGVWWVCFSSNNHIKEPDGLILENYMRRPLLSHTQNRHFKSIVQGKQGSHFSALKNAHYFQTLYGTVDEYFRPLTYGFMEELQPSYNFLRINHYICQSYEYFKNFKQHSGAADAGPAMIRSEESWRNDDISAEFDDTIHKFLAPTKALLNSIKNQNQLSITPC